MRQLKLFHLSRERDLRKLKYVTAIWAAGREEGILEGYRKALGLPIITGRMPKSIIDQAEEILKEGD